MNFPINPSVGDTYVFGGDTYVFNGYSWGRVLVTSTNITTYGVDATHTHGSIDEHVELYSKVTQNPTGLDTPLQVQLDNSYTGTAFDVTSAGIFTMKQPGLFDVRASMTLGRSNNTGDSFVIVRGDLDPGGAVAQGWVQHTEARAFEIESKRVSVPVLFNAVFEIPSVGVVAPKVRLVIYRDSIGVDDGGVISINSTLFGATASVSLNILHSS